MTVVLIESKHRFIDVSDWLTKITNDKNAYVDSGWELIDDLKDGIDQFGGKNRAAVSELYELASQQIEWSVKTLQNYVSIARSFPPQRRIQGLGISHYKAVLGLPDGEQDELLDKAFAHGMTEENLRYEVKQLRDNFVPLKRNEIVAQLATHTNGNGNGTNNHRVADSTYEQRADELAGDESSYDWTKEEAPEPQTLTFFDGSPVAATVKPDDPNSDEWYTPVEYIEAARSVMGSIDLDPATCDEAQGFIKAYNYYTEKEDGLTQDWFGNVWLNPPYSDPLPWVKKLVEAYGNGDIDSAMLLVNTANSPEWSRLLWHSKHAVCLLNKRVRFWRPDRPDAKGTAQDQMIWYLGDNKERFRQIFSAYGAIR